METIVFGGGCFWCTEAVFKMLKGVHAVAPGYAGGTAETAVYEKVARGTTGHAEVIKVDYDPKKVSFADLLTVFFASHDSTTIDRQGNDVGPQYRSIVFYTTEPQRQAILEFIRNVNSSDPAGDPVVTEVKALEKFYPAELYHHDFYKQNQANPYCRVIIAPKLKKVQERFARLLDRSYT